MTEYPLQSLLKRSDFTGRIAKWGTRLGSFNIRYKSRNAVKGQVLADFVAKFSPKNDTEMVCHRDAIITSKGIRLEHSFKLGFKTSNNEAEYEAPIVGLKTTFDLGARDMEVYLDSRLVINQVQGSFEARDSRMKEYLKVVKLIMAKFSMTSVT